MKCSVVPAPCKVQNDLILLIWTSPRTYSPSPCLIVSWLSRLLLYTLFSSVCTLAPLIVLDLMKCSRRDAVVLSTGIATMVPVSMFLMPTTAVFFVLIFLLACLFFSRSPKYISSTSTGPDIWSEFVKVCHVSLSLCNSTSRNNAELCLIFRSRCATYWICPWVISHSMGETASH